MRASRFAPLLISLALLSGTSAADEPADPAARAQALLAEARAETRAVDELLDAAGSRSVQRELHRKTARLEQIYDELATTLPAAGQVSWQVDSTDGGVQVRVGPDGPSVSVSDGPGAATDDDGDSDDDSVGGIVGGVVGPPPPPPPVSEPELASILAGLDGESFSDSKLALLRIAAGERWFTSDQARRVVEAFTFGDDKVAAGTLLYSRLVDPENRWVIYDAFDFETDKEKLRQAVEH